LATAADLAHHVLIHDETRQYWATWLARAGAPEVDAERGPVFRDASLVLDAAVGGQGVALGDDVLVGKDLTSGRLVCPLPFRVTFGAYWLVWPEGRSLTPAAAAFREWLLEERHATAGPMVRTAGRRLHEKSENLRPPSLQRNNGRDIIDL
jgi:LysR family transcriptional regulator, glycine cleavage system transcriptional activator